MEQQEIWKDIDGYDGHYQVSNFGRVRSDRGVRANGWYELRPSISSLDLARVTLYKNGKPGPVSIARLVAAAFIQSDLKGMLVMHRDADPMNNHCDNLFIVPKKRPTYERTICEESEINGRDLPGEKWKKIKSLDGRFAVSNMGRVKSLWQRRRNPILFQGTTQTGYKFVTVQINGENIMRLVHRLVAYHFCPKPADFHEQPSRYYQVNHKDENPANNRADNLEWVTCKENINYGHHNERVAKALGTEVWQYDLDGNYVGKFISIASAARAMGKKDAELQIKLCLDDNSNAITSYGYYWRLPNQPLKKIYGVEQIDPQGRVVAKYRTMAIAARVTGAKLASICRVTKGQQETAVGYSWRRAWVSPTECISRKRQPISAVQLSLFD